VKGGYRERATKELSSGLPAALLQPQGVGGALQRLEEDRLRVDRALPGRRADGLGGSVAPPAQLSMADGVPHRGGAGAASPSAHQLGTGQADGHRSAGIPAGSCPPPPRWSGSSAAVVWCEAAPVTGELIRAARRARPRNLTTSGWRTTKGSSAWATVGTASRGLSATCALGS